MPANQWLDFVGNHQHSIFAGTCVDIASCALDDVNRSHHSGDFIWYLPEVSGEAALQSINATVGGTQRRTRRTHPVNWTICNLPYQLLHLVSNWLSRNPQANDRSSKEPGS